MSAIGCFEHSLYILKSEKGHKRLSGDISTFSFITIRRDGRLSDGGVRIVSLSEINDKGLNNGPEEAYSNKSIVSVDTE